jgi:hypothetical protein
VSEWLLFNANSAIVQLYHGENKVNFQWDDDEIRFVLDKYAKLDFYSASSLKQQSALYMIITLCYEKSFDHIGGIMVSMFASSVIDRGFELRSGQTKDLYLLFLR